MCGGEILEGGGGYVGDSGYFLEAAKCVLLSGKGWRWVVNLNIVALFGEAPFCGRSWAIFHLPFSLCTASSGPPPLSHLH